MLLQVDALLVSNPKQVSEPSERAQYWTHIKEGKSKMMKQAAGFNVGKKNMSKNSSNHNREKTCVSSSKVTREFFSFQIIQRPVWLSSVE